MSHEFRVIQGCACPKNIAPYIAIVTQGVHVNSIYRGDDARWLLNKYGKSSQTQLWDLYQRGQGNPANPPGYSTHEQKSDGVAYPGISRGRDLPWWGLGFDVNDWDTGTVIAKAAQYHWQLFRPYPSGSEYHHLNFRVEPKPHSLATALKIIKLRVTLPRS